MHVLTDAQWGKFAELRRHYRPVGGRRSKLEPASQVNRGPKKQGRSMRQPGTPQRRMRVRDNVVIDLDAAAYEAIAIRVYDSVA